MYYHLRTKILTFFFLLPSSQGISALLHFDPAALSVNGKVPSNAELSVFERGGQLPGEYHVRLFVNDVYIEEKDVKFVINNDKLEPVFNKSDYLLMGISEDELPELKKLPDNSVINNIGNVIPGAGTDFSFINQKLVLSIPQAYIKFTAEDYVPPSQWEQGINAAFSSYDVSYNNRSRKGNIGTSSDSDNDIYMNTSNGFNIGGWRFRNNTTLSKISGSPYKWHSLSTYLQHDISAIESQFVLGQTYTSGDIFDSVGYTGVRLYSDDNMLPYSQQGLSPVINGIAQSQATVTVKQNGYVIQQVSVPAGPFSISNINTVNSGEIQVTIRESDGSERTFIQPWASIPGMQAAGRMRFAFDIGKYQPVSQAGAKSNFIQAQAQYGINSELTVYSGTQLANKYQSVQAGVAQSLGILGALSLDTTVAWADLRREKSNDKRQGQSYRLQYAKFIEGSNTNISVAGYRFSTEGYYDFAAFNEFDADNIYDSANKKSRIQVLIYQSLKDYGSLVFNAYHQDYWHLNRKEDTYSFGYSFNLWRANFNVMYLNSIYNNEKSNKQLALNVSLPFSVFSTQNWVNYSISGDGDKKVANNISLFGDLDKDHQWSYSARANHDNSAHQTGFSLGTTYRGYAGSAGLSYATDKFSNQINLNARGAVLVHPWGVTLANQLNDSAVLIRAPGAVNTKVLGGGTLKTDSRGYAVLTNASSYHRNRVGLDTSTLPDNVDIDTGVKIVVPTSGAITVADFKTFQGHQALVKLIYNGAPLRFGTPVSLEGDQTITGIVDDKGIVYLHGLPDKGKLIARWDIESKAACSAAFSFTGSNNDIDKMEMTCH